MTVSKMQVSVGLCIIDGVIRKPLLLAEVTRVRMASVSDFLKRIIIMRVIIILHVTHCLPALL